MKEMKCDACGKKFKQIPNWAKDHLADLPTHRSYSECDKILFDLSNELKSLTEESEK